jgi:predicted DNA-binding protein
MVQITLRIPEEVQELLRYEALRRGKSQNALITEALTSYLGKNQKALEKIKQAVVAARATGRRSLAESLQLADKAAALDDEEGLGPIKVSRRNAKR